MSLFQTLAPKPKHIEGATCLLLDVSGSMDARIIGEEGLEPRRIDQMFKVVRETPECTGLKAFAFSSQCYLLEVIPVEYDNYEPHGGTDLAGAFTFVKALGFYSAILITDGEPDNAASALNAAYGMKLGIIYIGNPPVPSFLENLAKATNGTFTIADMRDTKQLTDAIVRALPPPIATNEGPIKL